MPLNGDLAGVAVAAAVKAVAASIDPSGAVSDADLENVWKAACTEIFSHIKANMVVLVPAAGLVSAAPGNPVTGAATSGVIT